MRAAGPTPAVATPPPRQVMLCQRRTRLRVRGMNFKRERERKLPFLFFTLNPARWGARHFGRYEEGRLLRGRSG